MTPAGEILAAEVRRSGPVSFRQFMEVALYHPEHGYYRQARERFGRAGDFYTAEQIQPVFGILMAEHVRRLWEHMGRPDDFTVVELGAGRAEMAEAFAPWRYVPVEIGAGAAPDGIRGVVFANEFFDALPVEAAVFQHGVYREQRVGREADRWVWSLGGPVTPEVEDYLRRYYPPPEEGRWYEANLEALRWMERMGGVLREGWMLTIDYGFTVREAARFPAGTLMSYRRHTARDEVLEDPGARDLTAHVNFTALQEHGAACGLRTERLETLAQTLLASGEPDQFAAALHGGGPAEETRRSLQLQTLLFEMGETFRVLWQRRED